MAGVPDWFGHWWEDIVLECWWLGCDGWATGLQVGTVLMMSFCHLMLISGLNDDEAKLVNWLQRTPLRKYSLPPDSLLCGICKQRRLAVCSMYRINKSSSYQRLYMYLKNLSNCTYNVATDLWATLTNISIATCSLPQGVTTDEPYWHTFAPSKFAAEHKATQHQFLRPSPWRIHLEDINSFNFAS